MTWLSITTALITAAVALPLLLLLYLLKLRRRPQTVSSTFLWQRAIRDLQVNAPFQKFRRNILLLLQFLAILAVLIALAGPLLSLTSGPAKRYVILIDRSASMNTLEDQGSRLDLAKEQAATLIRSLRDRATFSLQDNSDQAMIIAFDDQAQVVTNFTSDKAQLLAGLDSIQTTHGTSNLGQALTIARAFAQSPGVEANDRSAQDLAQLELFSDGRIQDLAALVVQDDELNFHCIGETSNNLAIIALQCRRSYENPEEVLIYAGLANFSPEPVTCDLQLQIDGDIHAVQSVSLAAARSDQPDEPPTPTVTSASFTVTGVESGIVKVSHLWPDSLPDDNAAWSVLEPPRRLSALLVTPGNPALQSALRACPLAQLDTLSPAQFDTRFREQSSLPYDLVILDRHAPADLPRGRYLIFGPPPPDIDVTVAEAPLERQFIVDWRTQHPLLQYINLNGLYAAQCLALQLPQDAEILAEFTDGPALVLLHRAGSTFLLAPFDVLQTNWPFDVGFVMFNFNTTRYLGAQLGQQQRSLEVGQPIILDNLAPETNITIQTPLRPVNCSTDSAGTLRFADTRSAGIYQFTVAGQPQVFAVNLLSDQESNIAPAAALNLSAQTIAAQTQPVTRGNVPLWPILALIALALVCLEWFVYNSRVRL